MDELRTFLCVYLLCFLFYHLYFYANRILSICLKHKDGWWKRGELLILSWVQNAMLFFFPCCENEVSVPGSSPKRMEWRDLPGAPSFTSVPSLGLTAFSLCAVLNISWIHFECSVHSLYSSWGESPTSPGSSCRGDDRMADRILPTAVQSTCQLTEILKPFQI